VFLSMRFLQGRVRCCHHNCFLFRTDPIAHASVVPTLCKLRKGWGAPGDSFHERNRFTHLYDFDPALVIS
jgi:hypothetical protein